MTDGPGVAFNRDLHPAEARLAADFVRQTGVLAVRSAEAMRRNMGQLEPTEGRTMLSLMAVTHPDGGPLISRLRRGDLPRLQHYAGLVVANTLRGHDEDVDLADVFSMHAIMSYRCSDIVRLDMEDIPDIPNSGAYFLTQFASFLAWAIPKDTLMNGPHPHRFREAIDPQVRRIADAIAEVPEWLQAKFSMLANCLVRRAFVEGYIEREPAETIDDATLAAMTEQNDGLMAELTRLGRTSIRTDIVRTDDTVWSLQDTLNVQAWLATEAITADTRIQADRWLRTQMVAMERPAAEGDDHIDIAAVSTSNDEYDPGNLSRICFMNEQGELFADEHGTIALAAIYESYGKAANYQSLRSFLVAQYFNLSLPHQLVDAVNHQPAANRPAARISLLRAIGNADELDAFET